MTTLMRECAFNTERLAADEWHRTLGRAALAETVLAMLTSPVTDPLPREWQGSYGPGRAARWIAQRDAEATTLLVSERRSGTALGLMLLHAEVRPQADSVDVRLGYLLAEHAWGQGFGSELVGGFVAWARARPSIGTLIGGVAPTNAASIRILQRHGFSQAAGGGAADAELEYRLDLRA